MANRFPLIIDINDNNRIKELPAGDNLDLSQSGIVNAASINTLGQISAGSLLVNGQTLSTAALTGDYNDLVNTPTQFSGDYIDLSNKPFIPQFINNLTDVSLQQPSDGQVLTYNGTASQWEPQDSTQVDIGSNSINELSDVITTGIVENKYLKFYSGAWRPANITWAEILNRPLNLSDFTNDVGFITSETDNQTISLVGSELAISRGNTIDIGTIDITGSVFAKDSSIMVDTDTNAVASNLVSTPLITSGADLNLVAAGFAQITGQESVIDGTNRTQVTSNVDVDLFANTGNIGIVSAQGTVSMSGTTIGLNASSDVAINTPSLNLFSTGDVGIGFGSSLQISGSSQGDLIIVGNGLGEVVDASGAGSFILPTYTDAAARDAEILSPIGGTMVYLSSTGKFSAYDGVSAAWVDLN